jgi:hypothetical protein
VSLDEDGIEDEDEDLSTRWSDGSGFEACLVRASQLNCDSYVACLGFESRRLVESQLLPGSGGPRVSTEGRNLKSWVRFRERQMRLST